MFSLGDVTYPQIDQNGISGKSAKNDLTSPKHNFIGNGRTRLVYDLFWPQGPPKLQKIGLGWFPQLTRSPRADLRIFRIFLEISRCTPNPRKPSSWTSESEKNVWKLIFSKIFWNFKKYDTLAPFWYIYIGRTPSGSKITILWNHNDHISKAVGPALFWKPLK